MLHLVSDQRFDLFGENGELADRFLFVNLVVCIDC